MSLDITLIMGIAGAVASLSASMISQYFIKGRQGKETLEDRINKLTSALQQSSHLVGEIEKEIETRKNLVLELKQDADKYQNLVSLNREQVDAVAQLLQGELRKEGTKSFWKGVIANFIFFIMGAAFSWFSTQGF
jgi:hypothetical protein